MHHSQLNDNQHLRYAGLRRWMRPKLLATPDEFDAATMDDQEHRKTILHRHPNTVLQQRNVQLSQLEHQELEDGLLKTDLLGFGPIQPLVEDKSVSEIMANGAEVIFAERDGRMDETELAFDDEEHIQWTAQRIVRPLQRTFDRHNPMVDARLPDGSRVHLIMPPSALEGTTITIRKFPERAFTWQDLVGFGSMTEEVAEFLRACVISRLNIVVSGGTGSGQDDAAQRDEQLHSRR